MVECTTRFANPRPNSSKAGFRRVGELTDGLLESSERLLISELSVARGLIAQPGDRCQPRGEACSRFERAAGDVRRPACLTLLTGEITPPPQAVRRIACTGSDG